MLTTSTAQIRRIGVSAGILPHVAWVSSAVVFKNFFAPCTRCAELLQIRLVGRAWNCADLLCEQAPNFQHGEKFVPELSGEPKAFFKDYNAKYYHQTTDEYHDWWDMNAMIQEAEFALAIGTKLANAPGMPRFKSSDEFAAADKNRFKR